jgi:hypothetical protein
MTSLRDRVRDAELVSTCLKGDQLAWAKLIRSYQLLYSVARAYCRNPQDADEVSATPQFAERQQMPLASVGPTRARCLAKLRSVLSAA